MRTHRSGLGVAVAAALLLATSACGGGSSSSDDRPSTAELSSALRQTGDNSLFGDAGGKLTKDAADCIAKALHDSKISDKALRALAKGEKDYKANKADQQAAAKILPAMEKCVPSASQ